MKNFNHIYTPCYHKFATMLSIALTSTMVYAIDDKIPVDNQLPPITIDDNSLDNIEKKLANVEHQTIKEIQSSTKNDELPIVLPTETTQSTEKIPSKEESIAYFRQHPQEFEQFLSVLLKQGNVPALKELLPIYQEYPQHDPSIVEWGNAMIKASSGNFSEAIEDYRKLNVKFPNVKVLRFQLAIALYMNAQYQASKSEFEKLRTSTTDPEDLKAINNYLDAISKKNEWEFGLNVSYLNDKNINNAPAVGTQLSNQNGGVVTYNQPHQSGEGLNYSFSADKKWLSDNRLFTALHLATYGNYYWDNDKYNDVTMSLSTGVGFQNALTTLELAPFYNKRLYAGGTSGEGKLDDYSESYGLRATASQWLTPRLRYQGYFSYGQSKYTKLYQHNNGTDGVISNTLIYLPNQYNYITINQSHMDRQTKSKSDSFERNGLRLGWGKTWAKGVSTQFNLGIASRKYDDIDFFAIKRENTEYSLGTTIWKRDWSLLGLTPRLSWNYTKVESNSPFEEYDKHNVGLEFSKTF